MFEVSIIEHIQRIRCAFLDWFFLITTNLGDELFFILVAVALFWCIDKRFGYKLINVYLLGCACIEGVKHIVKRPRPFTHDGVVSVGKETSGYSFPSGHSHSIGNLSTQLSCQYRRLPVYITCGVVTLIVLFSRLYLGQHFLSDVIVGVAFGVGFALLFSMLFELLGDREEYIVLGVFPLCMIIMLILVCTGSQSGSVMTVLGGYSAVSLGYFLEKRYVKLNVKTKWYFQILKIVIGLALTLFIKEGFKLFLPEDIPFLYNFVRYFITAFVASFVVPLIFKYCRLDGKPDGDKARETEESQAEEAQAAETQAEENTAKTE